MKIISAFFLFVVTCIFGHSAALSNEEVINQLLLIRKNLLASAASTLPWPLYSSSSYSSSPFYRQENTQQQSRLTNGARSMFISPRSRAVLQRKKFQHMLSRVFVQIFNHAQDEVRARGNCRECESHTVEHAEAKMAEDYIKTRNPEREAEQADKIIQDLFTCLVQRTPKYKEFLKGGKIFGMPIGRILQAFQHLTGETSNFRSYYTTFLNIVKDFLPGGSVQSLVDKQNIGFFCEGKNRFLCRILKDQFKIFSAAENNSTLGHFLNIISVFLNGKSDPEGRAAFNSSINFFLHKYFQGNKQFSDAKKNAIQRAVNTVVLAILNGQDQDPDNRNNLLRSIITALAVFNVAVTNDTALLPFVDQLLSEDLTNSELQTKAECLVVLSIRNGLEYVLNAYAREDIDENNPIGCGVNGLKEGFRLILSSYIPVQVGNVSGCEGFPASSGHGTVAQEEAQDSLPQLWF